MPDLHYEADRDGQIRFLDAPEKEKVYSLNHRGNKTEIGSLDRVTIRLKTESYNPSVVALTSPTAVLDSIGTYFAEMDREHFGVVNLTARNTIINWSVLTIGTLNMSVVDAGEVIKAALLSNAAKIMLIHNHPGNDPSPSREDINVTKRIALAAQYMNIDVVDHMIVSPNGSYYSFMENGEMKTISKAVEKVAEQQTMYITERTDDYGTRNREMNNVFFDNEGKATSSLLRLCGLSREIPVADSDGIYKRLYHDAARDSDVSPEDRKILREVSAISLSYTQELSEYNGNPDLNHFYDAVLRYSSLIQQRETLKEQGQWTGSVWMSKTQNEKMVEERRRQQQEQEEHSLNEAITAAVKTVWRDASVSLVVPYSEHPSDSYLHTVIAKHNEKYTVWTYNEFTDALNNGIYDLSYGAALMKASMRLQDAEIRRSPDLYQIKGVVLDRDDMKNIADYFHETEREKQQHRDRGQYIVDTPQTVMGRLNERKEIPYRFGPVAGSHAESLKGRPVTPPETIRSILIHAYHFSPAEATEVANRAYSIQRSTDVSEAVALRQSIQSYAEKLEREHISTTFSFDHEASFGKYQLEKLLYDDRTMTLFRVGTNTFDDRTIRMQTITAVNNPENTGMRVTEYDLSLERIPTERELRSIFFQWQQNASEIGRIEYLYPNKRVDTSIEYASSTYMMTEMQRIQQQGIRARAVIYQSAIDRGDISQEQIQYLVGSGAVAAIEDAPSWTRTVKGEPDRVRFHYANELDGIYVMDPSADYQTDPDRIERIPVDRSDMDHHAAPRRDPAEEYAQAYYTEEIGKSRQRSAEYEV